MKVGHRACYALHAQVLVNCQNLKFEVPPKHPFHVLLKGAMRCWQAAHEMVSSARKSNVEII